MLDKDFYVGPPCISLRKCKLKGKVKYKVTKVHILSVWPFLFLRKTNSFKVAKHNKSPLVQYLLRVLYFCFFS